jgi:uncharacterized protein (TIGR00730 family)
MRQQRISSGGYMTHRPISRICVFCGSNSGVNPAYAEAARAFGALLAREGIALVYGGGNVGLMGAVADGALGQGGEVIGVIPHALALKEVAHAGLTQLHVCDTMHERKAKMADLADGFVALPGGLGTLDEMFEIVTWAQLGIHFKPCGFLNVAGYFDRLFSFLDSAVDEQLVRREHRELILVETDASRMLASMRAYIPPTIEQWVRRDER